MNDDMIRLQFHITRAVKLEFKRCFEATGGLTVIQMAGGFGPERLVLPF